MYYIRHIFVFQTKLILLSFALSLVVSDMAFSQNRPKGCVVAEFKTIALNTHDPIKKNEILKNWLSDNGVNCNNIQARIILSNAPSWLGPALSVEISGLVEGIYEKLILNDDKLMSELYLSAGKSFTPRLEVTTNPEPRAPIIQPNDSPLVIGSVTNIVNNNPEPKADLPKKKIQSLDLIIEILFV